MSLPKSLTQPLRQGQLTVGSGWRAYFAPFNQALAVTSGSTTQGPTIYDLQVLNKFIDGSSGPPTGWYDLGLVKNVKPAPASKTGNITTGYRGAIRAKYRGEVAEKVSFVFGEMSRMTLKIATGVQIFNLLAATVASTTGPLSATGTAAVAMTSYTPGTISGGAYTVLPTLAVASASGFVAGNYIVCDKDYDGTSYGFIGDAGANVFPSAVTDTDFIRKTSDYVARVVSISGNVLTLNANFVGGGQNSAGAATTYPQAGSKVQVITGYAAREGGTAINEWSAIFCLDTIDASQVMLYYPRLAPESFAGFESANVPNITSMQTNDLSASFDAMAFDDPLDGETVVRYAAYFPHPSQNIQI
jgi:hypothetical protein